MGSDDLLLNRSIVLIDGQWVHKNLNPAHSLLQELEGDEEGEEEDDVDVNAKVSFSGRLHPVCATPLSF